MARPPLMALSLILAAGAGAVEFQSHPPLQRVQPPSARPIAAGPARYADAARGDDSNPGTEKAPWKTINHAFTQLAAGDTLYLRGGRYFEQVYCAVRGRPDQPITIRSYPGELAVIDGGIPEFQTDPAHAWVPFPAGAEGEFVSARPHKNIRDVVGLFGDSNVGLQTYWYAMDLRATNELWIADKEIMVKPQYCGPGLWYDKETGLIHARLAHTHLALPESAQCPVANYAGETDPRKLPLVIAPFDAVPLFISQAMYVRFQDLLIRGGGYKTVHMQFGVGVEFEDCTIYAGTYGIWSKGTGPFKMTHCGVRGNIPPWAFRSENGLYSYDGEIYPPFTEGVIRPELAGPDKKAKPEPARHIARLNTHAVLATEGGYEHEVFYYPLNNNWDVSYCEFSDGHDGVYPSGRHIYFHHNWVGNMQDDGIYLSSPTPFVTDKLYVYQNVICRITSALAAHSRGGPGGDIYVFRNIIDMRGPLQYNRPSPEKPEGWIIDGSLAFLTHGRGMLSVERMYFYQNTCLIPMNNPNNTYAGSMIYGNLPGVARRVFNNIYAYYDGMAKGYPQFSLQDKDVDLQLDGNVYWSVSAGKAPPPDFLEKARADPLSTTNRSAISPGWESNSIAADPKFAKPVTVSRLRDGDNDYRLQKGSPAAGRGVVLPADWMDPLRPPDGARPDAGALPLGAEQLKVGIHGRIAAGSVDSRGLTTKR
jgi:hypothetical protein